MGWVTSALRTARARRPRTAVARLIAAIKSNMVLGAAVDHVSVCCCPLSVRAESESLCFGDAAPQLESERDTLRQVAQVR